MVLARHCFSIKGHVSSPRQVFPGERCVLHPSVDEIMDLTWSKETQKNYETENTHRGKKKNNLTLLHLLVDAWRISLIIPFGSVFLFWFWISFSGVASCCHSFWCPRRSFRFKAERIGLSRGRALRKEKERAPHHKNRNDEKVESTLTLTIVTGQENTTIVSHIHCDENPIINDQAISFSSSSLSNRKSFFKNFFQNSPGETQTESFLLNHF